MLGLEAFTQYDFMRNALLAGLLTAAVAGPLGVFIVLRGQGMLGDGLAHIAFGGLALGFYLNLYPLGTALLFATTAALGIQLLHSRGIVLSDTAVAIFFTAGLATGVILTYKSGGWNVDLFSFLFGSLLGVRTTDLLPILGLGAALLLTLLLFYKELFYVAFSEESAHVAGLPTTFLNALFATLTACTIVIASRIVGILLVSALLVIPAATALQTRTSFRKTLLLATTIGALAVFLGLWAAWTLDLPAGGAIAAASVLAFALTATTTSITRHARG